VSEAPRDPDAERTAELFADALALAADARSPFLDEACAGDPALRARVEKLLSVYPAAQSLFRVRPSTASAPASLVPANDLAPDPEIGRLVGSYRIASFIAAGGMGAVYLGERGDREFEKRVAIKLIRSGFGHADLLARFRNERQVLANLEHPNVARLLDGGSTDDGRPYIVMEYVDGAPIDRYADERRLTLAERLRLFLEVCDAVQYAHRHLVIHRDLKPTNILIDTSGHAKLLDFGIAKIIEPGGVAGGAEAAATAFRALTPSFASPEQIRGANMTTSTDVYSLGVVLFKLLTGTLPFALEGRTTAEAERIICEDEPPRPSRVVQTLAPAALADVASRRRALPGRLASTLGGDLDTIVLKALAKEPERRYATVADLASDVHRHLEGEPVLARPDSTLYRLSKFVRKHTVGVGVAAAFVLLLIAFTVVLAMQSRRLVIERDRATRAVEKSSAVNAFLQEMLASVDPRTNTEGKDITMKEVLDEAATKLEAGSLADEPELEAEIRATLGTSYEGLGLYDSAEPHLVRALEVRRAIHGPVHPDVAASLRDLAALTYRQGNFARAADLLEESISIRRQTESGDSTALAQTLNDLGVMRWELGDFRAAEALHQEALGIQRRAPGVIPHDVASGMINLGQLLQETDDLAGAESLFTGALDLLRSNYGDDHPTVATALSHLGRLRTTQGELNAADSLYRAALGIRRRVLGADHNDTASSLNNLARVHLMRGDLAGAEALYREAVATWERSLGPDHTDVATGLLNLGRVVRDRGQYTDADSLIERSLAIRRAQLGNGHADVAYALYDLGISKMDAGNPAAAELLLGEALTIRRKVEPVNPAEVAEALSALARSWLARGRAVDAEPALREALAILEEKRPGHWRRFETASLLGEALAAQRRFAEAESLIVPAAEALGSLPAAPAVRREQAVDRAVSLYRRWGNDDSAALWASRREPRGASP